MQASLGQEKLPMSNKRKSERTNNQSLLKVTSPNNKRAATPVGSSPRGDGAPQLSGASKRMVEIESKSSHMGVSSEKMLQIESSVKKSQLFDTDAGAFDSVRARLRESLAAALTLVSQSNSSDLKKDSENEATSTVVATNIESIAESCGSSGPFGSNKCSDVESASQEHLNIPKEAPHDWKYVDQEFQAYPGLSGDDTTFGNGFFFKDELLQGNGLSWALELDAQVHEVESIQPSEDTNEPVNHSPESVALGIELELFRLFGGVNKKYKEKGRSLLFNLKDRNNPELRERVMSGEISPERLCSMTAEELASKELSQWRMAKAEELDHMKVLPDSEAGVRRFVKKTHKGEYQVELDQDDAVVEDASLGVVSELKSSSDTRHHRGKADEVNEHRDGTYKITIPGDGADMQGLMVDDLRDLPPILSLDEFMESLDKEPPFENMSVDTETTTPALDEKRTKVHAEPLSPFHSSEAPMESNVQSKEVGTKSVKPPFANMPVDLGSTIPVSIKNIKVHADIHSPLRPSKVPTDSIVKNDKVEADGAERRFGNMGVDLGVTTRVSDEKSTKIDAESKEVGAKIVKSVDEAVSVKSQKGPDTNNTNMECFWKGLLQINTSSTVPVMAIYRSGEKASTKGWPEFIEIKGRVRLDPFDKFLQELPKSRSRAIMVAHFVLKNGCTVGERADLIELMDSYMADQRLGFAEPNTGIELYLCPPKSKPVELVIKHLPEEYTKTINDISTGLIGILVWRKDRVTNVVPPTSSQVKLTNKEQPLTYRTQTQLPDKDVRKNVSFASSVAPSPLLTNPTSNNDEDDDVPPGFGPPGGTREDDDLPEFDFVGGTIAPASRIPYQSPNLGRRMNTGHPRPGPPSHQMSQIRELIKKYGHGGGASAGNGTPIQPWKNDDDDDDMPEWNPEPARHRQLPQQSAGHPPRNPMLMSCVNRPFVQTPLDPLAKPVQPLEPPMMRHGTQWGSSRSKIPPGGVSGGQRTGGRLSRDRRPPNAGSGGRSRGF